MCGIMKICPNCQTANDDNAQNCSNCNYSFSSVVLYNAQNPVSFSQNPQRQNQYNQNQTYTPYSQNPQYNNNGYFQGQQNNPQYPPYSNQYYGNPYYQGIPQQNTAYANGNQPFNTPIANPNASSQEKKNNRNYIIIGVAILLVVAIIIVLKPMLFPSVNDLCAKGKYEEAYRKANSKQKPAVIAENVIAYLSGQEVKTFYDKTSFVLRNAWYQEVSKSNKTAILYLQGANRFGGKVTSYSLWVCDNTRNDWEYFTTVTDLDEEKYSNYDSETEKLKKQLDNEARKLIKMQKEDFSNTAISKSSINNINNLFANDLLDEVVLIKE